MHDRIDALAPYDRHALFTTWAFQPWWLLAGAILLGAYLYGVRRAHSRGNRVPAWRIVSFVAGVLLLEVTLASAIDAYAMAIFWMHMVEHLTLIMLVPALLVLGHPLSLVRDALPPARGEGFLRVLRSRPVGLLTDPLVGLVQYAAVIVGTHLTGFMDQMAMHPWLMTGEQVLYVVSGIWLLLPLIADEPIRWQVPYMLRLAILLGAMIPDTVVGIVLLQTSTDPFPMMMGMHPAWAPDPIRDIQTGGALMWAAGDGLMMFFAVGVVIALIASRQHQREGFGTWLESVRRQTMVDHVDKVEPGTRSDIDPDSDEALAAYNRMLGRLSGEK